MKFYIFSFFLAMTMPLFSTEHKVGKRPRQPADSVMDAMSVMIREMSASKVLFLPHCCVSNGKQQPKRRPENIANIDQKAKL